MDNVYNRISRRRRRGQGGFTLIELLVVIAVLAVLAGIVIFNVTGVANRGKTSACSTDVKSVQTAVDAYNNDNGTYPAAGALPSTVVMTGVGGIVPTYIHTAPISSATFNIDASGTVTSANVALGVGHLDGC
jgi:prepilin-type N-terminal cleavage/methylation domain-containing protein